MVVAHASMSHEEDDDAKKARAYRTTGTYPTNHLGNYDIQTTTDSYNTMALLRGQVKK